MQTNQIDRFQAPRINGQCGSGLEAKRLQDLIEQVESLPDSATRTVLRECLQSILSLHGTALARILQLVRDSGAAGGEVGDALVRDSQVRDMLLIHGLHPLR